MTFRRCFAACSQSSQRTVSLPVLLVALWGCTGHIQGEPGPGGASSGPKTGGAGSGPVTAVEPPPAQGDIRTLVAVSPAPAGALGLRGLTRKEYDNTVSAVLGEPVSLTSKWGEEVRDSGGFATARPISGTEVTDYFAAAEAVGGRVKASFTRLWGCAEGTAEQQCAAQFVTRTGRVAFRRPLLDVERDEYVALFEQARSTHGLALEDAASLVVQAILQSPSFMYHWELGPQPPAVDGDGNVRLTGHEVAARLSYFLTQAPPDAPLAEDADSGRVLDPQVLLSHAGRLLAGPTSAGLFHVLVAKLLNLSDDVGAVTGLDAALLEARHRFIDATLGKNEGGNIQALLLGTDYYVNEALAPLYGFSGVDGDALQAHAVDPAQRLGILTHADYLKYTGKDDDSMPPRRGLKLLTEFLCQEMPPMPAIPPDIHRESGQTQREFFEEVVEQQACARGCHGLIDPLGFAFENYGGSDWRTVDKASGKPIDASGSVTLPFGSVASYSGAPDLIRAIAGSEEYRQCMTRQAFRMALGRAETGFDVAPLQSALEAQRASGDDLRTTFAQVVASEAFRLRRLNDGEVSR